MGCLEGETQVEREGGEGAGEEASSRGHRRLEGRGQDAAVPPPWRNRKWAASPRAGAGSGGAPTPEGRRAGLSAS